MTKDDTQYVAVMFEEIRDQNNAILEAVGGMQPNVAKIPYMIADIAELKSDMKVVKAVVTNISKQQHDHEWRITKLEHAA